MFYDMADISLTAGLRCIPCMYLCCTSRDGMIKMIEDASIYMFRVVY
jgi:hypothetical protein